jgi:hypothetical protein
MLKGPPGSTCEGPSARSSEAHRDMAIKFEKTGDGTKG